MKILFVSLNFVPASGSPAELRYLTAILAKRGHEVTVYTTNTKNLREKLFPTTTVEDIDGVEVHYFDRRCRVRRFFYTPEMFEALRKNVAEFDVVHLYGFRSAQTTAGALAAYRAGVPYVYNGRAALTYSQGNWLFKRAFDRVLGQKLLRRAARLLAFNTVERNQYLSLGMPSEKIEMIPLGANPEAFENLPERGAMRARWNVGSDRKVALFLGRFNRIKGLDMLIPALAEARRQRPDLHLWLAGADSGVAGQIERQIAQLGLGPHVNWLGFLQGREKLEALVDCDFLVLSSRYDLFPNVLAEAWGCGKPVVITEGCGVADVVRDEQLGLVTPFDSQRFGRAMVELADDPALAAQIGQRGRDYVQNEINSWRIAERHEALYESILNHAGARSVSGAST